jgi:hypothetical protein
MRPEREHTLLRLVVGASDQADLPTGCRTGAFIAAPAPEIENRDLPPDVDTARSREERIEWFLASTYCTCGIRGDICTGHFYTLASCNVNGCGAPNAMRKSVAEQIDAGKSDREIFEALLKEHGPILVRPHLLP